MTSLSFGVTVNSSSDEEMVEAKITNRSDVNRSDKQMVKVIREVKSLGK